jgi:hypothetical protein
MHLIQALFLWLFMAGFAVGGAAAFQRFFPRESPWFGFMLPPLALVILLNFIEHFVALPNLLWLFPVLVALLAWLLLRSAIAWRELALPAAIFLGSFAFTYLIRCLQPDVLPSSDGISDLNKINNFCQGGTLPPIDSWLPPFHYVWYYSLQHYAASVIERLFDVQIGVAYNVAHAFLSALTCVAGAAAAHRLSGGRLWITIAIPFLIQSAATGTSAYIHLTMWNPGPSMWYANNISGGVIDYDHAVAASKLPGDQHIPPWLLSNPLWSWLAQDPYRERLELQAPGFWTWRDEYHANMSGHFLTLLAVFVVAELTLLQRSVWPWLMAVLTPLLAVDSSTWAYPIAVLLCGGTVALALLLGRRPAELVSSALILLGALILLWPSLYDVTSSPEVPDIMRTKTEWLVSWREFLVQWWPIILLWICGCCLFRQLSFGARWTLVVIPLMLIGVEIITIEGRYNTIEKMWGYTWGTGLITLFPIVAMRAHLEEVGSYLNEQFSLVWGKWLEYYRAAVRPTWFEQSWALLGSIFIFLWWLIRRSVGLPRKFIEFLGLLFFNEGLVFRVITGVLLFSATVALYAWIDNTVKWAPWKDTVFHLEGNGYVVRDDQKKKMLHVMEQVKRATFLSGKSAWCYNESPSLAVFTGNRSYSAWYYFESVANYPQEAEYRSNLNNDFYSGAMADPLKFLHDNNITGVVIWPDDAIPDNYLATLKTKLAADYDYIDCKGEGAQNAGVFLLRPLPPEVRLP